MADNSTKIVITAEDRTQAALASVRNGMAGMTGALGQMSQLAARIPAIGGLLGGGFAALGVAARHTIDFAAGLHDMSMQTGATVEQLSALRNVAEMNGVSLDEAGKALGKLAKNMVEAASGGKEQAATFSALGVALKGTGGALRESGDVMVDVAKAIAGLASPTERAAAAQLVFGKAGAALVPMLMDIAKEGQLAATVTAEQAENADRFADAMTKMKQNMRGMAERIGLELVEPLAALAESMNKVLAEEGARQEIRVVWLDRWINTLGTKLAGAQKTWADGMAAFWRTVGASGMAGRFSAQSAEAQAALDRLGIARNALDLRGWNDQPTVDGKRTGTSFADRLKAANAKDKKSKSSGGAPETYADRINQSVAGAINSSAIVKSRELAAEIEALDKLFFDAGLDVDIYTSALARLTGQTDKAAKEQDRLVQLLDATPTAKLEEARADMQLLSDALQAGRINEEQYTEAVQARLGMLNEKVKETKSIAEELGLTFTSAFEDAIVGGKKFSEVLNGLAQDILRIITRKTITEPIAKGIADFDWGSLFNFGGGRAEGGPVSAGNYYVVGENGPEILLPGSNGTVLPNRAGAGGNMVVNVIEAPGKGGTQQARQDGNTRILDVFVERIKASIAGDIADGRGAIPGALSNSYGLNRAAGGY